MDEHLARKKQLDDTRLDREKSNRKTKQKRRESQTLKRAFKTSQRRQQNAVTEMDLIPQIFDDID